jgi:hypothetical protein
MCDPTPMPRVRSLSLEAPGACFAASSAAGGWPLPPSGGHHTRRVHSSLAQSARDVH